ncbi:MAG: hypothetical protein DRP46_12885, partial [Candidatus Zixiibacteriota bacterium]
MLLTNKKKALAGLTRRARYLRISSGELDPSSPVGWQELVMVDGGSFFDDHNGNIVSLFWDESSRGCTEYSRLGRSNFARPGFLRQAQGKRQIQAKSGDLTIPLER